MQKAERLLAALDALEREYRDVFTRALSVCADGRWGLFGQNEHLHSFGVPEQLGELRELADAIDQMRARLGEAPFALHAEFEAARGRVDANAPGEPKIAQAWLQRLAGD